MKLNLNELKALIALTATLEPSDSLGCDGCHELTAEYADADLNGLKLSELLQKAELHIQQCKCCKDEYAALVTALRAVASDE